MADVVFVQMPFAAVERPSLALGLFTASLRAIGISTETVYANIDFAQRIGLWSHTLVRSSPPASLLGEWIFAESAFGEAVHTLEGCRDPSRHLAVDRDIAPLAMEHGGHGTLDALLVDLRRQAGEFVRGLAERILRGRPRVVGCTSMFDQHLGSLALLQHIKQRDPAVLTVLGGANCAGSMGRATHDSFPGVDFTVTGEFDQYADGFFSALLAAGGDAARVGPLPPNVLGPGDRGPEHRHAPLPPTAILTDMDRAAVPDYDDYFEQLSCSPLARYVIASLQVETSRGCWWGAKQHCTFCGLNAEGMAFRKKSAARAVEEIRTLTTRYGLGRFSATDNIIDMSYFQTVLPALAADQRRYNFFYETKANLKREHVAAMAAAGCNFIQPGIESLHDETLRIMKKGTTACANIQLLKHCLELGVTPSWSILCGFPGSDPEWMVEIAGDLPLLFHLPPPEGATPIRFDRFSPYHQRPAEFGLELEPRREYRHVYPLDDGTRADLAYFFSAKGGVPQRVKETARQAHEVARRWRAEFWSRKRAELLIASDDGDRLVVRDTRACATAATHELRGTAARVLRALRMPVALSAVAGRLAADGGPSVCDAEVAEGLAALRERRLLWRSSTQYIALPTPPATRPMPTSAESAVGKLDMARYLREKARFEAAFA